MPLEVIIPDRGPPIFKLSDELDAEFLRLLKKPAQDRDFHALLQGAVRYNGGGSYRVEGGWAGKLAKARVPVGAGLRILGAIGLALTAADVIEDITAVDFADIAEAMKKRGNDYFDGEAWLEWAAQFDREEVDAEIWRIRRHESEVFKIALRIGTLAARVNLEKMKPRKNKRPRRWRMTRRRANV